MLLAGPSSRSALLLLALLPTVGLACAPFAGSASAAEKPHVVPPPAVDEDPAPAAEVAVLAGGCFWGVQGVYQHVNGVTSAVSGYAGGAEKTAEYETVSEGGTGHAESVRITFDPRQVTYGQILQIFFSVVHDPTTLNRQGPDTGTQYRSAIFPVDEQQARVATAYIAQLNEARAFTHDIVTRIEPGKTFYPAEAYHQDFLALNPTNGYILVNDLPKIDTLKRLFPTAYRAKPVLVGRGR